VSGDADVDVFEPEVLETVELSDHLVDLVIGQLFENGQRLSTGYSWSPNFNHRSDYQILACSVRSLLHRRSNDTALASTGIYAKA